MNKTIEDRTRFLATEKWSFEERQEIQRVLDWDVDEPERAAEYIVWLEAEIAEWKEYAELWRWSENDCNKANRELEAEIAKLREKLIDCREALANYGVHDNDCLCSQGRSGRPTDDGGYEVLFGYGAHEKWYRRGESPPCTCGFSAAIGEATE